MAKFDSDTSLRPVALTLLSEPQSPRERSRTYDPFEAQPSIDSNDASAGQAAMSLGLLTVNSANDFAKLGFLSVFEPSARRNQARH